MASYNIRPLSFAEILDRAFRVLVDNFALLAGIACVVWVPYGFVTAVGHSSVVVNVLAALLIMIGGPIVHVALTAAVAKAYLGQPTTIGNAYADVRPIFLPIMGTYLVLEVLLILAFIALVVPGVYLSVCWSLVGPIMIVEKRFGMKALSRSRELVRGVWWQALGISFVAGFLVSLPGVALSFLWVFIPFLGPILTAATQGILVTYPLVALIIYYFDRRCRTEDFDLRLLAEQIRSESAAAGVRADGVSTVA
jgi:hypothetical protein